MAFSTNTNEHLIRSDIWSSDLKEVFQEDLIGWKYIDMLSGFPDGDTFHIPSVGAAEVQDYAEGQQIRYTDLATGDFEFRITEYVASGITIYDKFKQDSYYTSALTAKFVPEMNRALQVRMEIDALRLVPDNQTLNSPNTINDAHHRLVASGTNATLTLEDFFRASYALQKANVPLVGLTAIIDPSAAMSLALQTNVMNLMSPQPQWSRIVNDGAVSGMRFVTNIAGFDVYTSNYLHKGTGTETIDPGSGGASVTNGVNNLFFSTAASPFIGAIRQAPRVESERNKDFQRDEYVVTARYGLGLYRPEAVVTILSATNQVYAA